MVYGQYITISERASLRHVHDNCLTTITLPSERMIPEVNQSRPLKLIGVAVGRAKAAEAEQRIFQRDGYETIRLFGPCLASKLVINSTLLMAWEAMTVPADRIPLGRGQSFLLSIGVARKYGICSGKTQLVRRTKAFDKERESKVVCALRG